MWMSIFSSVSSSGFSAGVSSLRTSKVREPTRHSPAPLGKVFSRASSRSVSSISEAVEASAEESCR